MHGIAIACIWMQCESNLGHFRSIATLVEIIINEHIAKINMCTANVRIIPTAIATYS